MKQYDAIRKWLFDMEFKHHNKTSEIDEGDIYLLINKIATKEAK